MYVSREETVDNFVADESSSDENVDYNTIVGGELYFHSIVFYSGLFDSSIIVHMGFIVD